MMTCKEVLESLSSYLDEELKQEVAVEMRKHIGMCSDCRAEFDTLTMTIKLYTVPSLVHFPVSWGAITELQIFTGRPGNVVLSDLSFYRLGG